MHDTYQKLAADLREYSIYVPTGSTRSVVVEHSQNTIAFRMTEAETGWRLFQVRDDHVVHLTASEDVELDAALAFLRDTPAAQVHAANAERPISVLMGVSSVGSTDGRAVVHPSLAVVCPVPKATYMMPITWKVFPCFRCEFTDDDRPEEAGWRLRKVVRSGNWRRTPDPALQMRFAVQSTGVKSTGGKKMGIFALPKVMEILGQVQAGDGFLDLENWQRRRVNLTREEGKWSLVENKGKSLELFENEVEPWVHAFAFETFDVAMSGIKR